MSSTHSKMGGGKETSIFGDEEENPFKLPADELIFSFKEMERDRKIIEREKNKQLKIWEKNRPIREGCLRKICETDIEPTQLAINPNLQSKVNVAEAAGYTVPIERPKNRENRWKLIEKKREMFLVEQMLATKQDEIKRLEEVAKMKEDGLHCAENMLESDAKSFLVFFNDIKDETSKASKKLEDTRKEKNKKAADLREKNEKIQSVVSNINKNIELLTQYNNYRVFLEGLARDEVAEKIEKKNQDRKRKLREQARDAEEARKKKEN